MPPHSLLPQSAGSASNVSEADGYHLLQTLFRFIDLHDTLHFSLREDGVVRRTNAVEGGTKGVRLELIIAMRTTE